MNRYRPEATSMQQKQMFRLLDNDDSGLVDLKELVLRGVDAMDYSFMDIELRKARAISVTSGHKNASLMSCS